MGRRHIHTVCNCRAHLFPVPMRYGGQRWWYGRRVHVMYCPVSGIERYYVYTGRNHNRIRRVA